MLWGALDAIIEDVGTFEAYGDATPISFYATGKKQGYRLHRPQRLAPERRVNHITREEKRAHQRRRADLLGGIIAASLLAIGFLVGRASAGEPEHPAPTAVAHVEPVSVPYIPPLDQPAAPDPLASLDIPLPPELTAVLVASCEADGVPLDIALGVMDIETGGTFDPDVVNPVSGCYGLMQLSPEYFPSSLSPVENIEAGVAYLGELMARYDGVDAALTAYHDGHDTGRRGYANAVLEAAEKWQ